MSPPMVVRASARGLLALALVGMIVVLLSLPLAGANLPPAADAGVDQTIRPGEQVFFGAGGSSDPDGDPLSYSWDFNAADGISAQSILVAPSHTYTIPGTFVVTLTVSDGAATGSDTLNVFVQTN